MSNFNKTIGLQAHYTSCRYGRSGHAGFQTRAMSSSIKPDEQRTVERLGIYQPPRNFSAEQLVDFPKAYRNAYLDSGKLAVIKSSYVGQDYTGRGGNYFSHSLIIENLPDDIWPVDLYEWDGWKDKLLPGEDTEDASFELPAVTLTPDNEAYAFMELQEFINEDTDRKNQLAYMIQAVFMRRETSRNIVIREELETNGLFWIACLQKSFPPSYQKELDCSSYQFDPRACLAVNVTLGDTDFVLGENERKYQFYVFDFVTGKVSQVDYLNKYASTVSTWMSEQPDILQDFYAFTRHFDHNTLNNELVLMLYIFQLSIDKNLVLGEKELVEILDFINSYTKTEHFENILQIIGSADLIQSEKPAILIHLSRFFIKGNDCKLVCQLIIRLFDTHLFKNGGFLDEINALRSEAKEAFKSSYKQEFSTFFLSEKHLSKITEKVDLLSPEKLFFTINELISSIQTLDNQAKVHENDQLREFIKYVVLANVRQLNELKWLLAPFIDDHLAFASICVYISEIMENEVEESRRRFAILLNGVFTNAEYRFKVINTMKQSRITWNVLEEEWKYTIEKQRDKVAAHASYYQHVIQDNSEFSQYYLPVFSAEMWKLLSKIERQAQAIAWIQDKQIEYFTDHLLKEVFQSVSEQISFDPEDSKSDELDFMLVDQMKRRNIVLSPNRLMLRYAVTEAHFNNFDFDKQPIKEIEPALKGLDKKAYKEFSQFYLPFIFSSMTEKEQHGLAIKTVYYKKYIDVFKQYYGLFYEKRPSDKFDQADMAALMFWLHLKSDDEDYPTFKLFQKSAIDLLSSRIAKLKDKHYSRLLRHFHDDKITLSIKAQWDKIYSKTEEKRNTMVRSLFRKWRK